MKRLLSLVSLFAVTSAFAYSYVDDSTVTLSQPDRERPATVTYTLYGGEAKVDVTVLTNGVPVAADAVSGQVNTIVSAGEHTFSIDSTSWRHSVTNGVVLQFAVTGAGLASKGDYLAVNLVDGTYTYYANAAAVPGGVRADTWFGTQMLLKRVAAPNIQVMVGFNTRWESKRINPNGYGSAETTAFPSQITGDYYLGIYEFTAGNWEALEKGVLTGTQTPGVGTRKNAFTSAMNHYATHQTDWFKHPVSSVSQSDCTSLMAKLKTRSGLGFCLPSEEQWEYACRAGSVTSRYLVNGAEISDIATVACIFRKQNSYYGGAQNVQHPGYGCAIPCGLLTPNAWGFYDMYGNVSEWTATPYSETAYIIRGYDCAMSGEFDYSSARLYNGKTATSGRLGFRACCNVSGN